MQQKAIPIYFWAIGWKTTFLQWNSEKSRFIFDYDFKDINWLLSIEVLTFRDFGVISWVTSYWNRLYNLYLKSWSDIKRLFSELHCKKSWFSVDGSYNNGNSFLLHTLTENWKHCGARDWYLYCLIKPIPEKN